jgi:L-ascorbate metabolism protein UlaG (beta-lactamase superfamily)
MASPARIRFGTRAGPGESMRIDRVELHAAAATHKGNRYGFDRWRAAANMYLLDGSTSTFFAGDTASSTTRTILSSTRCGIEDGSSICAPSDRYAPWWKPGFRKGHLTHEDALDLFERLRASVLVPYHWGHSDT